MSENLIPTYDKSNWARGPWDNEPDRFDFVTHGYACFGLRNHSGSWCGYVGIPTTHPLYGKDYNDADVDVHGGITYAAKCSPPICHVPQPGMPDDVWWLGFDTGHAFDLSPVEVKLHATHHLNMGPFSDGATYKDMPYVRAEMEKLAKQLRELDNA